MSCGNRTEAIAGAGKMISSPNYPGKYPGDLDCNILLITEEETKIAIQFYNFSVVPGDIGRCWDWIDIHDGRDSSGNQIIARLPTKEACDTELHLLCFSKLRSVL